MSNTAIKQPISYLTQADNQTVYVQNKESNFVSAVLYLHNDSTRASVFLHMLNDALSANFISYEIICVDDACTDDTISAVKKAAEKSVTRIIHMSYYQGLETAMNAGMDLAIGDFLFEFDSTVMDYESGLIMEVYRKSLTGYDIVSASPAEKGRFTSRLFYTVFNRYARLQYTLRNETFRILSRRVINRVQDMSRNIPYRKVAYANSGLKISNMSYKSTNYIRTKKDSAERLELAANSLVLFTNLGYVMAIWLTVFMLLCTLGAGVYTVCIYYSASPVPGWTTTMLLLSIGFFCLFAILTIVIKYLSIMTKLIFARQKYVIEDIEKLS